jgi:hypothetical protein
VPFFSLIVIQKKNHTFVLETIKYSKDMSFKRKLPIGIQDFAKLRTGGNVYVDKTMYIEKLLNNDAPYFLGRPRRFGKSLFISTLKYYFQGRQDLFKGLYISSVEKEWVEYPVFHIEFVGSDYLSLEKFNAKLDENLSEIEARWGKDEKENFPNLRLWGLIRRAYEKTGKRVVILVDEYDKPLLESFDNQELNDQMCSVLKGFYGVLKGSDEYLKFVFLTGVTKFSKVTIFSDLNHLQDISMLNNYSGICGISERELLDNFQPEIQALSENLQLSHNEAIVELKKYYDGYHFAKVSEDMYNPFSLLNTLDSCDFAYYWFKTGTPTFLVKMLKNIDFNLPELESDVWVTENEVMDYRAENQNPIPVLYQSGYLTVKGYDRRFNKYRLGFPNEEVKYGFLRELVPAYWGKRIVVDGFSVEKLILALEAGETEKMMCILQSFYASIPYDLVEKQNKNERYFQMLFYLVFALMGQFIEIEHKSAKGRADAIVKTKDAIFVFEFKMDENATVEDALRQIDDKTYPIPYKADGRQIVKIGAVFKKDTAELAEWKIV